MTPIFSENSTWPSYIIKPIYNNYFDTANNLANNISSYGHTTHVTQNGTQMFPVMPYYLYGTKMGSETVHPAMYQHRGIVYNTQNVSVPIVHTTPQMV